MTALPSVGELTPKVLSERLARLPAGTRLLAAAVGSQPNLALLDSIVRGAPVEQVYDAYGAARSALRLLEAAGRSSWLGAKVDLGPGVERVLPRELPPITADETIMIVGRVNGAALPRELELSSSEGSVKQKLSVRYLRDFGDLRRRWAEERFDELRESGAGRASLVDIGRRFGLVTPFTSLYVPTRRESEQDQDSKPDSIAAEARKYERARRWRPWWNRDEQAPMVASAAMESDNKEGGTGTRAKGEEGSMGSSAAKADKRYAAQQPRRPRPKNLSDDSPKRGALACRGCEEAEEFGLSGLHGRVTSNQPNASRGDPSAPSFADSPAFAAARLRHNLRQNLRHAPPLAWASQGSAAAVTWPSAAAAAHSPTWTMQTLGALSATGPGTSAGAAKVTGRRAVPPSVA